MEGKPTPTEVSSLQPLPAVSAGSFSVAVIDVCMFRMCGCKSTEPTLIKLTTIYAHDVSQSRDLVIPALPLPHFFLGHRGRPGNEAMSVALT